MDDPLQGFGPATAAWFRSNFRAPTLAQAGAWDAIRRGQHTLVVAPTGSGKTLSAFLWALDKLSTTPRPEPSRRCRVLYVSPLKALAVDVERNLRAPLVGIGHAARRLGLDEVTEVEVAVRSGDTSATDRRRFATKGADILITTPESLFLLLTSQAREMLRGVEWVILDEVHAVADTKRGAHLAVSLARLDALLDSPATRIGLSATVRPVDEVARFLTGGAPAASVAPPATKTWDLEVVVPVPDMAALPSLEPGTGPQPTSSGSDLAAVRQVAPSLWPFVEERIVDLIAAHRSTLVFANSRRLAERLTARLNEIWADRLDPERVPPGQAHPPAVVMASGRAEGAPAVLARAHHGSVSRHQRAEIEEALKSGRLPAVVATSSLELGIDMGAVDLVIQVESPPSVASGLQRVGRAGHQVGAVSHGVLFPKFRGDLVATAVVTERMRTGAIESLHLPRNPLDVLAQQIIAMTAMEPWPVADLLALFRRTANFATLPESVFEATLDMLAGRYVDDDFADLRPRVVWDRVTDVVAARPGAQRLAITSGGTIPDRGLFGVFLAGGEGPGRRVGELDEEMVYESRVGDVFALGSSSWRIEEITHDRVLVTPAPGQPARLPFWKGDLVGRPAELGGAIGSFLRELAALPGDEARARVRVAGLDAWASDNLLAHLADQRAAIPTIPTDTAIVVERFRDEIGDWRVVVHSPWGNRVHAPWALAIAARFRERHGLDVDALPADDGIVLRLPDTGDAGEPAWARELTDLVVIDPDEIVDLVTAQLGSSAVFAARFRECAARALLLPRRNPTARQPLWQQRQRSAQLLEVAATHPDFPIVLEAVRECLHDVFDMTSLVTLLRRLRSREVTLTEAVTPQPSPFARGLLFGYVGHYLYEGDTPLAERRAAALTLDPTMLAELLGTGEGASLRDLLDPDACREVAREIGRLTPERACRDAEDVVDLVRALGPVGWEDVRDRCRPGVDVEAVVAGLVSARRLLEIRVGGHARLAVVEDAGRLRDGLGCPLPDGVPAAFLTPGPDPLAVLALRYARTHLPFAPAALADHLGLGVAVARATLDALVGRGQLSRGEFLPDELSCGGVEYAEPEVLRRLRRRSLAALRHQVEAVEAEQLARFAPAWQGVAHPRAGTAALVETLDQLAGARVPASALESLILPRRVSDFSPGMLDGLMASGELLWQGHRGVGRDDGWISLHPAETADLTLAPPELDSLTSDQKTLLSFLGAGGAHFAPAIAQAVDRPCDEAFAADLWTLVWAGAVTGDTLTALRAVLGGSRRPTRRQAPARPRLGRLGLLGSRPTPSARVGVVSPTLQGRWSALPIPVDDPTAATVARAEVLLMRHGVLTRGAVETEGAPGGFAAMHRVLSAAEEAGRVRRGYFVEGLGASQFASPGAVDRLRAIPRVEVAAEAEDASPLAHLGGDFAPRRAPQAIVLAAADPASVFGAALPWPASPTTARPSRRAGAVVVLVDGRLVLHLEKGGRTMLSWDHGPLILEAAAAALVASVERGELGTLTIRTIDGTDALAGGDVAAALESAGFRATPRGLRLRPGVG